MLFNGGGSGTGYSCVFVRLKEIMAEFGDLRVASSDLLSVLDKAGSPVVFCHNDLLCGNVVVNRKAGTYVSVGGVWCACVHVQLYAYTVLGMV